MRLTDGVVVTTPSTVVEMYCCFIVVDVGLQIKFLLGGLDGGVADAASVDLLELETLSEVVVEGGVCEGVEPRAEVLVAFSVGMEDVGDDHAGGGWRGGGRDDGSGELPVAFVDVDDGAIARRHPGHGGDCAHQREACVEGGTGGGGALDIGAAGDLSAPAGEEAGVMTHLLIEGCAIDEVIDIRGGDYGRWLIGSRSEQ